MIGVVCLYDCEYEEFLRERSAEEQANYVRISSFGDMYSLRPERVLFCEDFRNNIPNIPSINRNKEDVANYIIHIATKNKDTDLVCDLLDTEQNFWPTKTFYNRGILPQRIMFLAIRRCHLDMVKLLLDRGVSPEIADIQGCTALDVADKIMREGGSIEIVALLRLYGATR